MIKTYSVRNQLYNEYTISGTWLLSYDAALHSPTLKREMQAVPGPEIAVFTEQGFDQVPCNAYRVSNDKLLQFTNRITGECFVREFHKANVNYSNYWQSLIRARFVGTTAANDASRQYLEQRGRNDPVPKSYAEPWPIMRLWRSDALTDFYSSFPLPKKSSPWSKLFDVQCSINNILVSPLLLTEKEHKQTDTDNF